MSRDRSDFSIADRECEIDERMCSHHPEHDSILDFPIGCKIGCIAFIALVIAGLVAWGIHLFGGAR